LTEKRVIDRRLLEHLAHVSRLKLTDDELDKFTEQLQVILQAFREIEEVDTEGVEPSFHPLDVRNVLREDAVKAWKWDPLENSRHVEGRYLKGPRIT